MAPPPASLPSFDELPLDKNGPFANAWGLFGERDQLGMLNLLTPETVKAAATEIKEGVRVSLDWHLSKPVHPFFGRQVFYHHMHTKFPRTVNDDILLFNTQCSTQWDGFRHFGRGFTTFTFSLSPPRSLGNVVQLTVFTRKGYQDAKQFYSGFTQSDLEDTDALGINVWVENGGIVGRGVLLDYAAWATRHSIPVNPISRYSIPASHLRRLVDEENITFRPGDILFIRSGFTAAYEALTVEQEKNLPQRKESTLIGVQSNFEMARWLWENHFAAVAGDMPGFEQAPLWEAEVQLHQVILGGWGMPIGELFDLEELARECKRLGRNTFFVSSVPLKVIGGVASPPNAIAIF
ncbi:hypothetical protein MMC08_006326 [Hypocenomyce scalaris]|nr:hypothetical protein [Hypocenomyce scalaris]